MSIFTKSKIDKLIEKATNEVLIEPDLETTLQICDLVRAQDVTSKAAVTSISKRLTHVKPQVVLHSIYVLEALMKNCGPPMHEEVASHEFMHKLMSTTTISDEVRQQVLSCIQNWAYAFKNKPTYAPIVEAYENLRNKGFVFPEVSESNVMFTSDSAPAWQNNSVCYRCHNTFSTFRRRHHCRNCGNSVCQDCSPHNMPLPQLGIEKDVRVCTSCYDVIAHGHRADVPSVSNKDVRPAVVGGAKHEPAAASQKDRDRELAQREEEELQLALALSASEAETKQQRDGRGPSPAINQQPAPSAFTPPTGSLQLINNLDTSGVDPELARYLNKHYNAAANSDPAASAPLQPSAPIYASPNSVVQGYGSPADTSAAQPNKTWGQSSSPYPSSTAAGVDGSASSSSAHVPNVPDIGTPDEEQFLQALKGSVDIFVNRMQSNQQRGRSIVPDTTVQMLFKSLHQMHPQLLAYQQSMEGRRAFFEGLQDKLTQLNEAREALDSLRVEDATRRRLEEEEAARQRHAQMMQKLEVMRQQKREALELKRRMALEQTLHYQNQYQYHHQSQFPTTPQQPYAGGYQTYSPIPNVDYQLGQPSYAAQPGAGYPTPASMPGNPYQSMPPVNYQPMPSSNGTAASGALNSNPFNPNAAMMQPGAGNPFNPAAQQQPIYAQPYTYQGQMVYNQPPPSEQPTGVPSAYAPPPVDNQSSAGPPAVNNVYSMQAMDANLPPTQPNFDQQHQQHHQQVPQQQPPPVQGHPPDEYTGQGQPSATPVAADQAALAAQLPNACPVMLPPPAAVTTPQPGNEAQLISFE